MPAKKSVYVETTIPSLITARTSKDLITAYRQDISKLFWENERNKYDLFISQYVFAECSDGDTEAAKRRLELIKDISYIPITELYSHSVTSILNVKLKIL